MADIFNDSGIIVEGLDEVRSNMKADAEVKFADILDGKPLRADDSSILGRLFAITAKPKVETSELLPQILAAFDANQVEDQQADNLFGQLWGIPRLSPSQATGLLILSGDIGTLVAKGSEVTNYITGDSYSIDNDVTFGNVSVNGVVIENTLTGANTYRINYSIDGLLSESAPIDIQTTITDTTVRLVADRIVDAINSQSAYLTATRNNDNTVKVVITDQSNVGTFTTTPNLLIIKSYSQAYATSVTFNAKESKAGQVTSIKTSTSGWDSVTNPFYIFPSVGTESDEDYRYRAKLQKGSATGKYNSIIMALKSVRGVTYENVVANTSSNTTGSGITNNGLSVTVLGGNEDEIALALFNSVGDGVGMVGDIIKQVSDINGFPHLVRFSRPKTRALQISMSLVVFPDFPSNGKSLIRQALVDYFNNLNVGEDIYYSRLSDPINSVKGFAFRNLKIGYVGGTLGTDDIVLSHNELATLSAEDIIIGGSS